MGTDARMVLRMGRRSSRNHTDVRSNTCSRDARANHLARVEYRGVGDECSNDRGDLVRTRRQGSGSRARSSCSGPSDSAQQGQRPRGCTGRPFDDRRGRAAVDPRCRATRNEPGLPSRERRSRCRPPSVGPSGCRSRLEVDQPGRCGRDGHRCRPVGRCGHRHHGDRTDRHLARLHPAGSLRHRRPLIKAATRPSAARRGPRQFDPIVRSLIRPQSLVWCRRVL